jgi:hypothetical protein
MTDAPSPEPRASRKVRARQTVRNALSSCHVTEARICSGERWWVVHALTAIRSALTTNWPATTTKRPRVQRERKKPEKPPAPVPGEGLDGADNVTCFFYLFADAVAGAVAIDGAVSLAWDEAGGRLIARTAATDVGVFRVPRHHATPRASRPTRS